MPTIFWDTVSKVSLTNEKFQHSWL